MYKNVKRQSIIIIGIFFLLTTSLYMGHMGTTLASLQENSQYTYYNPLTVAPDQDQPMGVVVVDDLHDNDYADGDMDTIITDLENQGYIAFYTSDFNSFQDAVAAANYLVISAPFASFSLGERTAIASWFEDGSRNMILASRGDFSQPDYETVNTLFGELGATTKVQDDNVYTTDANVPQPWYIDSDNFDITAFPDIFEGVDPISFFSPSSINPGDNGQIIINAEAQAYQSNENGDPAEVIYDNTNDNVGGEAIPLAVYEEVTKGTQVDRIVSVGTTLWSDFDYGAPSFGDITFFNNLLQYLRQETIDTVGEIDLNVEDTVSPDVSIGFPHDNAYIKGSVEIDIDGFDAFGITEYEITINNVQVATTEKYTWDTTNLDDGIYTVKATVWDEAGNSASITHSYNVVQSFEPFLEADPKVMTYNIKESGVFEPWFDVLLEENADVIVLVETGNFDDNNNALLQSTLDDLNAYFFDEVKYQGYTLQNIGNSFDGISILSRYDIQSSQKLDSLQDDAGNNIAIPLPFLHSVISIGDTDVNIIGAHLTCCPGQSNWNQRYEQQESMINFMDDLGDQPIIYLGDFNAVSPDDVNPDTQNVEDDLGTDPIEMLLDPNHPAASEVHTFVDVAQQMGTKDDTFIGSILSRIDFIFVNQFFHNLIVSSTTGDTKSAKIGSDHVSVDVVLDMSASLTETTYNLSVITTYETAAEDSEGREVGLTSIVYVSFVLGMIPVWAIRRRN